MQLLVDYSWPGNVRELQNLVESMVVLAPGHEITADDIPREIREGGSARFLPVPVSPILRQEAAGLAPGGRELEFIVRSLVELKLQMEELRRRVEAAGGMKGEEIAAPGERWVGEVRPSVTPHSVAAIEPREQEAPPNEVTIRPGMTMDEIMRAAIEVALREARGNRRKAAKMLGMGERTLYRKLKDYNLPGL
jgi:DNA-binding NtrC family response regulator